MRFRCAKCGLELNGDARCWYRRGVAAGRAEVRALFQAGCGNDRCEGEAPP
jgi:hypothetical protein